MSNFLSQPIQYQKPPTDSNFELLSKVALAQQQKYDVNHQQIQKTLDAFGAMKTLRPEDDAYISAKLNSITTQINASGGNLANQSTSDSLMSKVKAVAQDPFILNAMEQTKKMATYQAELAKIKEKKPELYNDVNNSFALNQAGYADYLAGKKDKMGSLTYSPYVDVTKSTLEKVKQLKDLRGEQTIKTPVLDSAGQPTGRTVERTIKGLTEDEIFQYFPDLLTGAENHQLVIDGWDKYKNQMPSAQAEFKNYTDTKEQQLDKLVKEAQTIVDNTTNSEDKIKEAKERIKALNAQKANVTTLKQSIDVNNAVQLGGYLHQRHFQDGIANMAQAKWSEEFGVDEYYFDKANLDIKKEELEISKEKLKLERQKAGVLPTADAISVSAREGATPDLNPMKQLQGDYNETYNEMIAVTKGAYNSDRTTDEMRNQFKSEMNKMGYDENGNVINQALANKNSKASAFKVAFAESNMNYVHGDAAKKLSGLEMKRSALANEFGTVSRSSLKETFAKDPDKYVGDIFEKMATLYTQNANGVGQSSKKADDLYFEVTGKHLTDGQKRDIQFGFSESFIGGMIAPKTVQEELKKAFLNDPTKLQLLEKHMGKAPENTGALTDQSGRFVPSLLADAKDEANNRLIQKTKEGRNIYFNTSNIATIKDENLRKNIVGMLPQDADTALFDSKNPMSFYKNADGSITIKQNKGYTAGKEQVALRDAEVTVDKEDAAYKELLKYVDLTEKGRGLNAGRTKVEVKPYRAPYYMDSSKGEVLAKVDQQMVQLPTNMLNSLFVAPPSNYLTKDRTEEVYKKALKDKVPEEKIGAFVNELSTKLSGFKIKLYPFDGQWSIQLKSPDGDNITSGGTGMVDLEDDAAGLIENYPQTLISDWILRELVKNPKKIDTILQ